MEQGSNEVRVMTVHGAKGLEARVVVMLDADPSPRKAERTTVLIDWPIALIAMVDWILIHIGHIFSPDLNLSLNWIFGKAFYPMAWAMGVPEVDINNAATLLGQKLTVNEFVAFKSLTDKAVPIFTEKGLLIVSIAICGFANFSSVGMQIGGIGALAPERRADLAKLGLKALLCGTLASYLSATLAGIII